MVITECLWHVYYHQHRKMYLNAFIMENTDKAKKKKCAKYS